MTTELANKLQALLADLNSFTAGCGHDMHEPDNAGIRATVVGDHLDNACGERIKVHAIKEKYQEYVVRLGNEDGGRLDVNLATLIALARLATPESIAEGLGTVSQEKLNEVMQESVEESPDTFYYCYHDDEQELIVRALDETNANAEAESLGIVVGSAEMEVFDTEEEAQEHLETFRLRKELEEVQDRLNRGHRMDSEAFARLQERRDELQYELQGR